MENLRGIDIWKPKDGYGESRNRFSRRIYGIDPRKPKMVMEDLGDRSSWRIDGMDPPSRGI